MEIRGIDYLKYQSYLQIKKDKDQNKVLIFDPIRRKNLILQPEELVRQLTIQFLSNELEYPLRFMAVEVGLQVNNLSKRCDIIVYTKKIQPILLIECKAAAVKLDQAVFSQIATYNMTLKVPYLMVTNGSKTYCAKVNFERADFQFLNKIPTYNSLEFS